MLEGWYCRSMASQQQNNENRINAFDIKKEDLSDDSGDELPQTSSHAKSQKNNIDGVIDYKARYLMLKRKLKFLIYENEYFQDTLRFNQRRLLKISRDRSFLLERLLQYEKPDNSTSDSEATDTSDDEASALTTPQPTTSASVSQKEVTKKRKIDGKNSSNGTPTGATRGRKRKLPQTHNTHQQQASMKQKPKQQAQQQSQSMLQEQQSPLLTSSCNVEQTKQHNIELTTAELARQLQERKPTSIDFMSAECTSPTVPATMLSDESPSKCYSNEQLHHFMDDSSHVAAEECVAMEYTSS